jgi:phenylacetate-CoA ligase
MDLLKSLIRNFTYDFYLRRDGLKMEGLRERLEASQYLSSDELLSRQLGDLKSILAFCSEHNKYYQKQFNNCGFQPDDLKDFSDLDKLPVLTKDDIREAGDGLFSAGYNKSNCFYNRTGGSTGVPLRTYMDPHAVSIKKAATLRHNSWANLIPGERVACVWGDTDKKQSLRARLREKLTDRSFYLDTLKFDSEHIEAFLKKIRKYKPPVLMGHAHSIFRLAEYVRDNNVGDISFKGIITTAMVLSDSERANIENVFHSPVFNRYGCEELSIIASECEAHDGMHIFAEGLYVELLDENKNTPGKLIITDLVNRAMPMIRYEIGDYAVGAKGDCLCGRSLPCLQEVSGRVADFLYTPEKKPVFGISILDTFIIHIPGFKQVQIVQKLYDLLDFYIVRDKNYSEDSLGILKKNVAEIFGPNMRYETHFVEKIKQTERGKFRFSICNIDRTKE